MLVRFPVTFSTLILRHTDFLWKTEQNESYILKLEKSWLKIWQSLVPGLLCDLPSCVARHLCNALKYEFLPGIIAYKQLVMLMLQKKSNHFLFSIFC